MFMLALEYCASVFVSIIGVFQLTATYNGLKGLSFFNNRILGYTFGTIAIILPYAAFFTWNKRNATGVIEGAQQFYFFTIALAVALIFTILLSSLIKHKQLKSNIPEQNGLEALKEVTFIQAIILWWSNRK